MKTPAICAILAVTCVAQVAFAENLYSMQTEHFRVHYPAAHSAKAEVVAQAAEIALLPLTSSLDVELNQIIDITLFESRTAMFETLGSPIKPGVMGLALPERGEILIGIVDDESMARTPAHEVAHIIIHLMANSCPTKKGCWGTQPSLMS